jgi:hypothetical protein
MRERGPTPGPPGEAPPSVLNSLPNDPGDVGAQLAQGPLAALDRVVLQATRAQPFTRRRRRCERPR